MLLLLEHDAKELARARGVAVPAGLFIPSGGHCPPSGLPDGPWVVKAQLATGGRGKAGGIVAADTPEEVAAASERLAQMQLGARPVRGVRVESRIPFVAEAYVSFSVDPTSGCFQVLLSAEGGVDVEASAHAAGTLLRCLVSSGLEELTQKSKALAEELPSAVRGAVIGSIPSLARLFLDFEATLLEINPLFVLPDDSWVAGDMKLAIDENALVRQPALRERVLERPDAYTEAAFKLRHGFDYVEIDPEGDIGLLTTGAGLSMSLIDDMLRGGHRPINFCDLRSGMLRGDPQRLIEVLRRFSRAPRIRVVLVNIFAGITDLREFAALLLQALDAVPELQVPVVTRLIGNNFAAARELIAEARHRIMLLEDLDRAVALALQNAGQAHA